MDAKTKYKNYWKNERAADIGRYQSTLRFVNFSGKRCLDVGGAPGVFAKMLAERGNEVVVVDASEAGVQKARDRGVRAYLVDVSTEGLPFEDDSFDAVFCLETLEHLENPSFCIKEIKRVLKPDSPLICSIPNTRRKHEYIHPELFTWNGFSVFLKSSGFRIANYEGYFFFHGSLFLPAQVRNWIGDHYRCLAGCWMFQAIHMKQKLQKQNKS